MMGSVSASIAVVVALIAIVGVAIPIMNNLNTSGLDSTQQLIYGYIPTFLLLGGGFMLVIKAFF